MNIEIANRLYKYRKAMGISQEELAEKIGVSRQAVSKWERAEASPDTDNLIELSKVYGVTLDEMLRGKDEAPDGSPSSEGNSEESPEATVEEDKVHIGFDGIHVHDKHGTKVDIDRRGIFVNENGEQKVYTDADGHVHRSADCPSNCDEKQKSFWHYIPYPLIAAIAYLVFGYCNICGGWGWGWIVFLTIPIYYSIVSAIEHRDPNRFAYPVLAVIIFLVLGFFGFWHPGWIVFLTAPLYYGIINAFRNRRR